MIYICYQVFGSILGFSIKFVYDFDFDDLRRDTLAFWEIRLMDEAQGLLELDDRQLATLPLEVLLC